MNTNELRPVIYLSEATASVKCSINESSFIIATIKEQTLYNVPYVPMSLLVLCNDAIKGYAETTTELVRIWNLFDCSDTSDERNSAHVALSNKFAELSNILSAMKNVHD